MENKQHCQCLSYTGKRTEMEKIGSWQTDEAHDDYDAEYTTLYQCPECKRVLLT